MFLEKLEILGFKSFARKTVFHFNSGITGIVGPNGCGKTNIVDAMRWVLGEQKAGTLRGERMENVIFNGSRTMKPLGMAEVSMIIKNTKNLLPVEFTEVQLTRRLYRSGESQYLLNNTPCRLKDILNLFMDSGMGFDAYSVIELKMVETILSGKPEERRKIFEQAAGISKYKQRRVAAFRKLENTEKDLLRVNDIIAEVQKNVDSLARQVRKAKRYQTLMDELRELEIKTATYQFSKILNDLDPVLDDYERLKKDSDSINTKLNLLEADVENLRTQLVQVEQKLTAAQQKLNEVNRKIQQKENQILLARERINAINESARKDQKEQAELTERLTNLENEQQVLETQLTTYKNELAQAEQLYQQNKIILEETTTQLNAQKPHLEAVEKDHLLVLEQISTQTTEQERLKIQNEHHRQRIHFLTQEASRLQAEIEQTQSVQNEKTRQLATLTDDLTHKSQQKDDVEQQLSGLLEQAEQLKEAVFKNKNRVEDLENKILLLRQVIESREDYPEGVRHLLLEQGESNGYLGAVADFLSIPEEYRLAIEVFLGETSTYLITESKEKALAGIQLLKGSQKGHVTFIPLAFGSSASPESPQLRALLGDSAIIARADEVVNCDPKYQSVFNNILSRCYLVKDFAAAERLAVQFNDFDLYFVSTTGESVATRGWIKGGSRPVKQTGPIGRADELKKQELKQTELIDEIEKYETQQERTRQEIERLSKIKEQLILQIQEINQQKTTFQIAVEQAKFQTQNHQQALAKNLEEKQSIETRINELQQKSAEVGPLLSQLEARRKALETQLIQIREELARIEKQNNAQADQVHQLNLEVVALQGKLTNTARELEQNRQLAAEYVKTICTKTENIETGKQQKIEFEGQIEQANSDLEVDFERQDELEKIVHRHEAERGEISRKIDELARRSRGTRFDRDQSSEKIHNLELKISELRLKAENIQQRMLEEFEVQIKREELDADVSLESLKNHLEAVRLRLRTLGAVNLLAIEEYDKEKERLDFLVSQQQDLNEARDTLNRTIELINETAQTQFLETYRKIRVNFKEVFKSFFPNGEADLVMPESGDVLENEIEVIANSKGKRLGSLALLSGGEKTLTAISLLFAIYLVKPSPFCILDEVDAPLDDVNIERFITAIKEFADRTQFILVTHNKLTMKAADSLYGITMPTDGVSKVVSVKMEI